MVGKDLTEVNVTADADDLVAATAVVVLALADVVFDDDYIVVGVTGLVVVFVVVVADNHADFLAVFHVGAQYLSKN